ncbi:MAG TPA: zf-HC2 domain-containing protein [Candidatus Binatia bacterium]
MKRHRSSPSRKRIGSSNNNKTGESRFRPLTCEKETALIADYLASNLGRADLASFENHLEECPDCKAFLQTYKKTIEITRSFFELESAKARQRKPARRAANSRQRRN